MPNALRSIADFNDLLTYLGDELDWPVEDYGLEDLTFEYDADELGLKEEEAEKLADGTIRQLRPLPGGQPFGIFFVEFGQAKLPVVVLRRILNALVLKKRNSANPADRQRWDAADLLFISAFGEDEEREIAFAHFHKDPETTELPVLRVLGWDGADTPLKLSHVAQVLKIRLTWPENPDDHEAWRTQWRGAFRHRLGHVIKTSSDLADALAGFAQKIRDAATTIMKHESEANGQLRKLHRAFQQALIHDLGEADFADTYAQTVTYGLLTAAISRTEMSAGRHGTALTQEDITAMVPVTNPFLKEMLQEFLKVGGRKDGVDFDELGINEVVELLRGDETDLPAILRDFGNRKPGEDPVIHFYEHFLAAYNKKLRVQRGVFYTPQPVVGYIVRSVHELLQTEFNLEDGLASIITWGEMVNQNPDLNLPPLTDEPDETRTISPDEPFVQILDPATGTATFLVEVIEVIFQTLESKWKEMGWHTKRREEAWNDYVPKHLLPRLHGYELMMAPYAIAHMKIGLKLAETGYRFSTEERARIYLTNALEPKVSQLPVIGFDALANEAAAVNEVKWYKRFTVVIGNPPYAKLSANRSSYAESLVEPYKQLVSKERNVQPLSDDYIKFIAFAIHHTRTTSLSLVSLITNRSWLDGLIHRGMRMAISREFNRVSIIDCHGDNNVGEDVPSGYQNDNLFDIRQGVAICCFVRNPESTKSLEWGEIWGNRDEKYKKLDQMTHQSEKNQITEPSSPNYFFKESSENPNSYSYLSYPSLIEIFGTGNTRSDQGQRYGNGIKSNRDGLLIDFDESVLKRRMLRFTDRTVTDGDLKLEFGLEDGPYWNTSRERAKINPSTADSIILPITYRPFDQRWIWYQVNLIQIGRGGASRKLMYNLAGKGNIALLSSRNSQSPNFTSVFTTRYLSEMKTAESTRASYCFPLYIEDEHAELDLGTSKTPNFSLKFLSHLSITLGLPQKGEHQLPEDITPEDLFHYIYAVFHSPAYRSRYAEFLKIDFPRLPLTGNLELFHELARLGCELSALHLLESPTLDDAITSFIGDNHQISKVGWTPDNGGTVWLDGKGAKGKYQPGTSGFRPMSEEVWNFHIGGYQVCEKWLKDRGPKKGKPGRTLSEEDIAHYHKIVIALTNTIRLMSEIDEVIETHGGWPGAFEVQSQEEAK